MGKRPGAGHPARDIEMLWIFLTGLSERQQRAVCFLNDTPDVFVEDASEIGTLSLCDVVIALMVLASEKISSAPNDRDHRDAKLRRGLRECVDPFGHS